MTPEREQLQRRARRNAWLLALLALAFYVTYYLVQASKTAG